MRVWLDDERPMPDGFDVHVKTAAEAIALLQGGQVMEISLDHDLAFEHYSGQSTEGTGYDVAKYIERAAYEGTLQRIRVRIHSQNPVGVRRMKAAIQNAHRFWMT